MADTPLHTWLRRRLQKLLEEAVVAGFARDAAEAVLIDLATSTEFNDAPPPVDLAGPLP
jgi:hypothetical protein